jgi:hypothetical protein
MRRSQTESGPEGGEPTEPIPFSGCLSGDITDSQLQRNEVANYSNAEIYRLGPFDSADVPCTEPA